MDLNQDFPIKSETLNLRVLFSKNRFISLLALPNIASPNAWKLQS